MNGDGLRQLLEFLKRLDEARIRYTMDRVREDAIMVRIAVPGERWEVELVDYGDEFHWEVERFVGGGRIDDESALDGLFARFSDARPAPAEQAAL
ncbi:MAG: hypothetical protein ACRC33_26840 [Gemmataceae bacterium]